jgi:iron complex outermembrane receptor protein
MAILALMAGTNVYAADAPAAQAAEQSAAATAAADKNSTSITEVYVTATKRTTSLQKTPIAITALNAQTLEDNHVQTLLDVVNLVPGFQATGQGDHGVTTMTLRGIGNDSAKTEYADPEVATFVDGIYSPRPEGATACCSTSTPSKCCAARRARCGAATPPSAQSTCRPPSRCSAAAPAASKRLRRLRALRRPRRLQHPAGRRPPAMRIAVVHEQHDGYVDYQAFNAPSLADQHARHGRPRAAPMPRWPSSRSTRTCSCATARNTAPRTRPRRACPSCGSRAARCAGTSPTSASRTAARRTMNLMQTPRAGQDFWSALIDTAPEPEARFRLGALARRIPAEPDMQLTYIAGWSKFDGSSTFDQDAGADLPTSFSTGGNHQENNTVYSHYTNYSHELEMQSLGKRTVDWQLGLYYGAEDNGIRFDIPIMNGTQQGTWAGRVPSSSLRKP